MSSKISTLIVAVLVINVAILWETTASAQSVELLNAIKTAEEQRQQGKLTEALQTLTAIKPTNSVESSHKDKELQELVTTFLTTQQSEQAVITAQRIGNHELRNGVLLDILHRQCNAAKKNPESFDLMIAKAEKTARLLTGRYRDEGFLTLRNLRTSQNKALLDIFRHQFQEARNSRNNLENFNLIVDQAEKTALSLTGHFRDNALYELARLSRPSEKSVEIASHITDQALRNTVLLEILKNQFDALRRNPEEFDQVIGKAEKTATLLTGRSRDEGYGIIAQKYYSAGKHTRAMEIWNKMEVAECRDESLVATISGVVGSPENTLEDGERIRDLMNLIQLPLPKAWALSRLADYYSRMAYHYEWVAKQASEVDYKKKRLDALQEAVELLLSLPGGLPKAELLRRIHSQLYASEQKAETETVRKALFESILSIEDKEEMFFSLSNKFDFLSYSPSSPLQPDPLTDDFIEKLSLIVGKVNDPQTRAKHWRTLWAITRNMSENQERREAFHKKSWQTALEIDDLGERVAVLLTLINFDYLSDKEEINTLIDGVTATILAPGNERNNGNNDRRKLMVHVILHVTKSSTIDRVLEIICSPQVPDTWKPELCQQMVYRLYYRSGEIQYDLEDRTVDWPELIEKFFVVSDTWDSTTRFETYRLTSGEFCKKKIDVDVLPLLDRMLQIAETEKEIDISRKGDLFIVTQNLAQQYSLWDEIRIGDWLKRYEALLAEVPDAAERFRLLRMTLTKAGIFRKNETLTNVRIDRLLAAAREIPEQNIRARHDAFLVTARQATTDNLSDRAREIIDEALEFSGAISDRVLAETLIQELAHLRDQLQGR